MELRVLVFCNISIFSQSTASNHRQPLLTLPGRGSYNPGNFICAVRQQVICLRSEVCLRVLYGENRRYDIEKIVENLVYQQMVRLGYEVKVGQLYSTGIDFVGTKGDEVVYVQAAYLITEGKTFNREFGNLMLIKDNFPKYVISMTPYMDSSKWEGIIHIPFADFLT